MEKSKQKSKKKMGIIIFISVILIILLIFLNTKASNENSLDSIGYVFFALIDYIFLSLMWIVYLLKLSIKKRKNNEKYFWIPMIFAIFIMVMPIIVYFTILSAKNSIMQYYNI